MDLWISTHNLNKKRMFFSLVKGGQASSSSGKQHRMGGPWRFPHRAQSFRQAGNNGCSAALAVERRSFLLFLKCTGTL